jgi:hypothetical protein
MIKYEKELDYPKACFKVAKYRSEHNHQLEETDDVDIALRLGRRGRPSFIMVGEGKQDERMQKYYDAVEKHTKIELDKLLP